MEENFKSLEKFNFWNGNVPQQGFLRIAYLDNILGFSNNKLVKVLVGQRRTGKSYILRQIANNLIKNGILPTQIFYLNKEFIDFDFVKTYQDLEILIQLYLKNLNPNGKVYLFLDEIQSIEGWERLVNSYSQDFTANYEIYISGSNSKMLSGELATLLSGRYVSFEIFPFSFKEYTGITRQEANKSSYINYMQSGGLPELFELPNEETKRHYISSVKDTVLLRDIIQRHAIKDPKLLEDVFVYLVNNASNMMSINNITNYLKSSGRKTTFDTIANYIGYIEDTFLIHKAERFDIKGKDTIAGNAKYYCNDLAYKNYLYKGFGYGIGYQLENLVYLALRRLNFDVYVGVIPNKEVDFVAKKGDQTLYIQCAYLLHDETTLNREYASLEAINDNYPKIIVSLDDVSLPQKNGIIHAQAWEFEDLAIRIST
ncbi:ATP-binding protein [Belliella sp. R4-6]|uniref:ATP-binding protein n=1 Tax=Belliella alkalica TaxID=1730871 RepID=A0ABS9VDB8_9BACT|nr:ATP-binding protein [Belliella alkalica]MCH7414426.1 ATP-binding protein [Belliella alkalica]